MASKILGYVRALQLLAPTRDMLGDKISINHENISIYHPPRAGSARSNANEIRDGCQSYVM